MVQKFALSTLLLTLATIATADECAPNPCCPPPDPCAPCAQLWPSRGPDWIVTPNAGPCVSCGADLFVTGEFLYWTAREDYLGYAMTNGAATSAASPSTPKGTVFHPDWKFKPGFRVGLGMLFDHDGWDIYANYTWQRYHDITGQPSNFSSTKPLSDFIWFINYQANGNSGGSTVSNSSASAKWHLDFNVIDLELGRNFFVSRYLYLRPHFGLKGTWQEQKMDVAFTGIASTSSGGTTTVFAFTDQSNNKSNYWGIGLRTGLDSAWHFSRSFSLVGEVAITALWERFEVTRSDSLHNTTSNNFTVIAHTQDNFHTIKPIFEIYGGLRWETWFCCDSYHMSIEAGWEEQLWNNQNQFIQFVMETRTGDLVLQGLTVKVRFDF